MVGSFPILDMVVAILSHPMMHLALYARTEYFFPKGKWAALGGSAIPRQPVAGTRQASFPQPNSKNQFNI